MLFELTDEGLRICSRGRQIPEANEDNWESVKADCDSWVKSRMEWIRDMESHSLDEWYGLYATVFKMPSAHASMMLTSALMLWADAVKGEA